VEAWNVPPDTPVVDARAAGAARSEQRHTTTDATNAQSARRQHCSSGAVDAGTPAPTTPLFLLPLVLLFQEAVVDASKWAHLLHATPWRCRRGMRGRNAPTAPSRTRNVTARSILLIILLLVASRIGSSRRFLVGLEVY